MNIQLRVCKVIVLGGSSGIGLAIAKALYGEGCNVCIVGTNEERMKAICKEYNNNRFTYLRYDLLDFEHYTELLNDAACLLGGYYDGVVNSAGVHSGKNNWIIDELTWDNILDIDLKATIFMIKTVVACMRDNNTKGNILQISSVCGNGGNIMNSPYYIAKNAVTNCIRYMAKEIFHHGIILNGICPGIVKTPMCPGEKVSEKTAAIGRPIEPDEIASIALFMMSKQAEICVGECILADGGFWGAW